MGVIESSYENLDTFQLIPSFFKWLGGGVLNNGEGTLFGIGLILIVGLISFLTFKGFRYEKAMIVSAIITWFTALLSLKMDWIGSGVFSLTCIYVVIALYFLYKESSAEEP
jgi:Ca2+/Na+ antiporter